MNFKEFANLLVKNTNGTLGNACLIRLITNDEIRFITEDKATPNEQFPMKAGVDIAAVYFTNGQTGIISTGEITNVSDILAVVKPQPGTGDKVWRMGAEIGDMLYVYDANGVSKINLTGMKSPTIVFDDNWTPGVNGFVKGNFVRRAAKR